MFNPDRPIRAGILNVHARDDTTAINTKDSGGDVYEATERMRRARYL